MQFGAAQSSARSLGQQKYASLQHTGGTPADGEATIHAKSAICARRQWGQVCKLCAGHPQKLQNFDGSSRHMEVRMPL